MPREAMLLISRSPCNRPLLERIQRRVVVAPSGCWAWQGRIDKGGYGRYNAGPGQWLVHRIMYMLLKGPIPGGMHLDHLCRNKRCCNPDHLEVVTAIENRRRQRGYEAPGGIYICPRGHELVGANIQPNGRTARGALVRTCRACRQITKERWRKSRHAELPA